MDQRQTTDYGLQTTDYRLKTTDSLLRLRIKVRGAVQGVGFRPFVHHLATDLGCAGWVRNSAQGVCIEVENTKQQLDCFLLRLEKEKPPRSFIQSLESVLLDVVGYRGFEICKSLGGEKTTLILPDIATCDECLREVFDPANRRYRYPFTNCTHCGPRFSIIEALPYDRPNTTMKAFTLCEDCRAEYKNPRDRRFHAQPNACPRCGPHLELWDSRGKALASHDEALLCTTGALQEGKIVAIKGLGGFHLMTDARNKQAVRRLREAKAREEKPFALMYPSLERVRADCEVSKLEERLLLSPESPIVLLRRRTPSAIAGSVAPDNPYLGVMLPYTPLHYLLMAELGFPIVATSGNVSDEPICIDEHEALERLGGMADLFLVHNRPIARYVDDSITRVLLDRVQVLRRARGYAPLPIELPKALPTLLAVGGHLKNTVAISVGTHAFLSQHIGDLETPAAFDSFHDTIACLTQVYDVDPVSVACDAHPGYHSTHYARDTGLPVVPVQHHYGHVLACMAENEIAAPVLGVSWDGTGYGPDGTVWGGEFLKITPTAFNRVAHLRTFPLPGSEAAIKEPRRSALGLLYALYGPEIFEKRGLAPLDAFSSRERNIAQQALEHVVNAPITSSAGRLFDTVASILGMRQRIRYEGQAAMELEFALPSERNNECYDFDLRESDGVIVIDWARMVETIVEDAARGVPVATVSLRFHNTLAAIVCAVAQRIGIERVALTGGCFQNAYLTERCVDRLNAAGHRPYWHQRVPPNDGGVSLGQLVAAGRKEKGEASCA